jgi:formylglycine-generating enzyme
MKKNRFLIFIIFSFKVCLFGCREKPVIQKEGMVLINGVENINDFWLDVSPVTVGQFAKFIEETNYITESDKFGDGGVFDFENGSWKLEKEANWEYPFGKKSAASLHNHPVTQVSWNDALAYCKWAKKRLPTSEEFIFAEKNSKSDHDETYTWGQDFLENGKYKTNFWQGTFPMINTVADGFLSTSPVGYYGKNKLGLTDIEGNVWQWVSDNSKKRAGEKNQRGGSFLCDPEVCHGFKIGGESSSSPETSLCHVGFRCAKDIEEN